MSKQSSVRYHVEAWDTLQHLFKVKKINDYTLHFAAKFLGKLNFDRLNQAVALSADAFPLIRCRLNENNGRPYWDDKDFTSNDMIQLIKTENTEESILRFLYQEADAMNGPQLRIGILRNGEVDTLCATMNHMLCDAAGFKDYLYLLSSIYTNIGENPDYRPKSVMGDRKIRQVLNTFSIWDKLKILFKKNDVTTHDAAKFEFEGDLKNPFIEMRTIPQDQFCLIKAYAKGHAATVNDVMLTAFIRVLFHLFGRVVTVPCAIDLRKYLPDRKAGSLCNLVTNLNCNIGPDLGASFDDTLIKVNLAMEKEKSNIGCIKSLALMELAFNVLPYKAARNFVEKGFSNAPIAFTNIGILDKKFLHFGETEIKEAYMTGSIKYAPYFQLAVSTFDNEVTFSINFHGTQSDRRKISLFCDEFNRELHNAM
jgi:NRPS condensation-like uncharacterized protein